MYNCQNTVTIETSHIVYDLRSFNVNAAANIEFRKSDPWERITLFDRYEFFSVSLSGKGVAGIVVLDLNMNAVYMDQKISCWF